jgi:hypothetical protein
MALTLVARPAIGDAAVQASHYRILKFVFTKVTTGVWADRLPTGISHS